MSGPLGQCHPLLSIWVRVNGSGAHWPDLPIYREIVLETTQRERQRTSDLRLALLAAVDRERVERERERAWCTRGEHYVDPDDIAAGRSWCKTHEAERIKLYRERKRAA